MDKEKIDRLKDVMTEKSYSQKRLADETGYTPQYINSLLKGRRPIQRECAEILAERLNVRKEYLLCEDDYKTNREKILFEMSKPGEIRVCFDNLLFALGYKIESSENPNDSLNDNMIIIDSLSLKHKIDDQKYEDFQKHIIDYIDFIVKKL